MRCLKTASTFACGLLSLTVTMDDFTRLFRRDSPKEAAYRAACTLATCPLSTSYYAYRPSLTTNSALLALFSLSLCGFILQAALSRRFVGFTVAMVSGCILEVLGYIGRVMSYHNPFNQVCFSSARRLRRQRIHPC